MSLKDVAYDSMPVEQTQNVTATFRFTGDCTLAQWMREGTFVEHICTALKEYGARHKTSSPFATSVLVNFEEEAEKICAILEFGAEMEAWLSELQQRLKPDDAVDLIQEALQDYQMVRAAHSTPTLQ